MGKRGVIGIVSRLLFRVGLTDAQNTLARRELMNDKFGLMRNILLDS
jgi:hypothetical protein